MSCNIFELNKLMFCGEWWQLIGPPKICVGSTQFLELNLNSWLEYEYNKAVYNMNNEMIRDYFPRKASNDTVFSFKIVIHDLFSIPIHNLL